MSNTKVEHEITNQCTCQTYNEDTDEYEDAPECWGDCWELQTEDFCEDIEALLSANETGWWKVTALRLWDGDHSGYICTNGLNGSDHTVATAVLEAMTVQSAWTMLYSVDTDTMTVSYSLMHHDAPCGSSSTLSIVTADEVERLGLYA